MGFHKIPAGKNIPYDIYAIIEIPAHSSPIKYEINKSFNSLMVDRFMATPMFYPANYGFINNTLAEDGDPLDVLVITPHPVVPGTVIHCRPIGMLNMSDESGRDEKVVAVPQDKICLNYKDIVEYTDLPEMQIKQIEHFFENYKDLEKGKWVKIENWEGIEATHKIISKYAQAHLDNQQQ